MWQEHYQQLARYNRWQNRRHYQLCESLDDTERKRDRHLFFHSIHGTLNHLLLTDRLWLSRFLGQSFDIEGLDQVLYANFETLRAEREATDQVLLDYVHSIDELLLNGTLSYVSASTGEARHYPLRLTLTHLFNHQTHHRGQLTAAYSQMGLDVGVTDLLFMPAEA